MKVWLSFVSLKAFGRIGSFQSKHRHSGLVEKYIVSLKKLLQQGVSEPEFYDDLVYSFWKNCMEI